MVKLSLVIFMVVAVLGFGGMVVASEHGGGEHHGYGPEKIKDLIWRVMNFAVLAGVLTWALKKPMGKMLSDRQAGIKQKFADLEAQKAEMEKLYAEHEKKLASVEQEAKKIMQEYVEQGKAEKARIILEANKTADLIKKQADLSVQQEVKRAKVVLSAEIAQHAVKLAEDLIKKNLDQSDHQRLIDDYIAKVVHKN
ncbi:MAG: F0F1 ATP synthase subunit B [Pseudomonadota bacterium]